MGEGRRRRRQHPDQRSDEVSVDKDAQPGRRRWATAHSSFLTTNSYPPASNGPIRRPPSARPSAPGPVDASATDRPDHVGDVPLPPPGFASTEHLATEAVAAYVDGELRMAAHLRAARHIAACPECAAEVEAHTAARAVLRDAGEITTPLRLLGQLTQIPTREIDLRADDRIGERSRGPLSAPGFPIHRHGRRRNR